MKYPIIPFEQPAGTFYMSALPAEEVIRISKSNPRLFNPETLTSEGGIQRELSSRRVKGIASYAETSDAAFPTPILLAIDSRDCVLEEDSIEISGSRVADIVDGQHRVYGLDRSSVKGSFVLPVVFIIDATPDEKALLFATINGTQTKVPASLIYELFDVFPSRSPQKTCHEIARTLNSMSESPWFRRLKMLGRKSVSGSLETLSQGTFIKFLLPLVSSDPVGDMEALKKSPVSPEHSECVFNSFFREQNDSMILKILLNLFGGAKRVWSSEWDDPSRFILTKTLGFSGIMRALPEMVRRGKENGDLTIEYFVRVFTRAKQKMESENIVLTSEHFSASASGEAKFANMIKAEIAGAVEPTP